MTISKFDDVIPFGFLFIFTSLEKNMKNFSIHLILIALLFVVGPTIHKMVMAKQQKATVCTPISEADQSSFENENDESGNQLVCILPDSMNLFHKQISSSISALLLPLSIADTSFLPHPI